MGTRNDCCIKNSLKGQQGFVWKVRLLIVNNFTAIERYTKKNLTENSARLCLKSVECLSLTISAQYSVIQRKDSHIQQGFIWKVRLPMLNHFTVIERYTKKNLACSARLLMKSGDYLSSQRLTVSTFGVKELNFCVRNGNRWILFAIITAMVIYSAFAVYIHLYLIFLED